MAVKTCVNSLEGKALGLGSGAAGGAIGVKICVNSLAEFCATREGAATCGGGEMDAGIGGSASKMSVASSARLSRKGGG